MKTQEKLWYSIKLIDKQGFTITEETDISARGGCRANLKECKERARYLLSEDYARSCESTRENMGFDKVEIWLGDDCMWDESI